MTRLVFLAPVALFALLALVIWTAGAWAGLAVALLSLVPMRALDRRVMGR